MEIFLTVFSDAKGEPSADAQGYILFGPNKPILLEVLAGDPGDVHV